MSDFCVYMAEVGILLPEDDKDYGCYNCAFDKKHGYYNETFDFFRNLEDAKNFVKQYVEDGNPTTYGVITVDNEIDEETFAELERTGCTSDVELTSTDFDVNNVVFSLLKKGNCTLVENFVGSDIPNDEIFVLTEGIRIRQVCL